MRDVQGIYGWVIKCSSVMTRAVFHRIWLIGISGFIQQVSCYSSLPNREKTGRGKLFLGVHVHFLTILNIHIFDTASALNIITVGTHTVQ